MAHTAVLSSDLHILQVSAKYGTVVSEHGRGKSSSGGIFLPSLFSPSLFSLPFSPFLSIGSHLDPGRASETASAD